MSERVVKNDLVVETNKKVDLFDYVTILIKWRKFVGISVLVITGLAVIISFLLPNWYKATASILPPKEQDILSPFGAAGSVLKGLTSPKKLGTLGQNLGAYNYLAILKSRSAMESVIRRFDLIRIYDISNNSMEKTIKELRDNTSFEIQDEDYITIEAYDKDPQRAADIANSFVEVLNEISIELATREARNNREFIEKNLEKSKAELRRSEDILRSYQEKTRIMVAPDQNSPGISAIAELYGMKVKKEIELSIMKKTLTKDSPLISQLELELKELNRKLSTFPELGIESFRLLRNVAIQQKIVEYLIPLHEQAKVDEQKNVPVLLVLDKAIPTEQKEKPKRALVVVSAALSSFILAIGWVILGAALRHYEEQHPGRFARLRSLWRSNSEKA